MPTDPAEPEVAEPPLTPPAYMAMAMIRDGIATGYRIKQQLERVAAFFWSASYGQIYPELRRLESAGLIAGRDVTESGRLRREFSLTDSGARELQRWLAGPAEPSVWIRDEGLLRLLLTDWDDREVALENLGHVRRASAERLEHLTSLTPPRERGKRLLDLGIRLLEEQLAWCDDTEAALRRRR